MTSFAENAPRAYSPATPADTVRTTAARLLYDTQAINDRFMSNMQPGDYTVPGKSLVNADQLNRHCQSYANAMNREIDFNLRVCVERKRIIKPYRPLGPTPPETVKQTLARMAAQDSDRGGWLADLAIDSALLSQAHPAQLVPALRQRLIESDQDAIDTTMADFKRFANITRELGNMPTDELKTHLLAHYDMFFRSLRNHLLGIAEEGPVKSGTFLGEFSATKAFAALDKLFEEAMSNSTSLSEEHEVKLLDHEVYKKQLVIIGQAKRCASWLVYQQTSGPLPHA